MRVLHYRYLCKELGVSPARGHVGCVVGIGYAYTYVHVQVLGRKGLLDPGRLHFADGDKGNVGLRYLRNRLVLDYRESSRYPTRLNPSACQRALSDCQCSIYSGTRGKHCAQCRMKMGNETNTHIGSEQRRHDLLEGRLDLSSSTVTIKRRDEL